MKVLQLISSAGLFGAERVVLELSKELPALGVESVVGVFKNPGESETALGREAMENSLEVAAIPCRWKVDPSTLKELRNCVLDRRFDVIHSHGYKADIYAYLSRVGMRTRLVSTCHNWIPGEARMAFYYGLQKRVLRRFDRVVAVSDNVLKELVRIGIPECKRTLIQNGIDLKAFEAGRSLKSDLGLPAGSYVIGSVGRLSEEKGVRDLLRIADRVCRLHEDVFFLVVGDGPLRRELEDLSRQSGLEGRVVFAGQRRDICNVYKTLDLLLLTSYTEGLPMVILEAMGSSLPIVASGVGGVVDLIEDGKSGILLRPGDVEGFSRAVEALKEDPSRARRLGEEACQSAWEQSGSRKMASRYLATYEAAAGRG